MNTLSKTVTGTWFKSPEGYNDLESRWSQIVNSPQRKQLTAADHLIYALLRGKDWRKGLTPVSARKLEHGGWYCSGIFVSLSNLNSSSNSAWNSFLTRIGDGIVDENAIGVLRSIIAPYPKQNVLPASAYDEAAVHLLLPEAEVTHV